MMLLIIVCHLWFHGPYYFAQTSLTLMLLDWTTCNCPYIHSPQCYYMHSIVLLWVYIYYGCWDMQWVSMHFCMGPIHLVFSWAYREVHQGALWFLCNDFPTMLSFFTTPFGCTLDRETVFRCQSAFCTKSEYQVLIGKNSSMSSFGVDINWIASAFADLVELLSISWHGCCC